MSHVRLSPALVLLALLGACSTPSYDLTAWRAETSRPRPEAARGDPAVELAEIDRRRDDLDLASARTLALALAAEHPGDGAVLFRASRAESDGVLLASEDDEEARSLAALSALDFAERAVAAGEAGTESEAQLAWSLGTTTHLRSMGDRSAHARRTMALTEAVLNRDPEQPRALATMALLNLRLETLPWIASLMASGLPESSLEDAELAARRAVDRVPSRENRLILAKVLVAADEEDEARRVAETALRAAPTHPRDAETEPALRRFLAGL